MLRLLARGLGTLLAVWLPLSCIEVPRNYSADDAPRFEPRPVVTPGRQVLALALGSGGPRAYAHIGVLKALEAEGIVPDLVVGTSAGAIAGALYAAGYTAGELERLALDTCPLSLIDLAVSDFGWIRGVALRDKLDGLLNGVTLEELEIPLGVITTHVETGSLEILNRGNAALAVTASAAIPGVMFPVVIEGEHYVDGDIVSPVPIRAARQLGADIVIAIDVQAQLDDAPRMPFYSSEWLSYGTLRRKIVDLEVDEQTILVRPALSYYTGLSTAYRKRVIDAGEEALLEALPKLRALLDQRLPEQKEARHAWQRPTRRTALGEPAPVWL